LKIVNINMKKTSGGKRKNAGRKPVSDKKVQVAFYIEGSKIEKLGGLDAFKEKIIAYVERSCKAS
jgi:hypothetical protein